MRLYSLLTIVLLGFGGCGSGGGSSTGGDATSPVMVTGYLLDSAISNIEYRCGSTTGTTGTDGSFSCPENSSVSFYVGDILLGSIDSLPSDGYVMPQDICGVDSTDTSDTNVLRIAQFLQSLDSDGNPDNGISITDTTKQLFVDENITLTDLDSSAFTTLMSRKNITLRDSSAVVAHLENTLSTIQRLTPTDSSGASSEEPESTSDTSEPTPETNPSETPPDTTVPRFMGVYTLTGTRRLDTNESNLTLNTLSDVRAMMDEPLSPHGISLTSSRSAIIQTITISNETIRFKYLLDDSNCSTGIIEDNVTLIASDISGNRGTYTFSLGFECNLPPSLLSFTPDDEAIAVATASDFNMTFNENIVAVAGKNVIIKKSSDDSTVETIAADSAKITVNGPKVSINPATLLTEMTGYYILIDNGAFTDTEGKPFTGIDSNTAWNFTTADETAPTVTALSPTDDASTIGTSTNLVLTFSENVTAISGKNILIKKSSDDATVEAIAADSSKVSIDGTQVTINPDATLDQGTDYHITIDSGAFSDSTGNTYAGISDNSSWNFTTTDTTAPSVSSVDVPADDTYITNQNMDFTVNYSESITITGTPRLLLNIGGTLKYATYQSGSGTTALIFRYTTESGLSDNDGITLSSMEANGGTLQDASGNDASLTLNNIADTSAILVDSIAPTVSNIYRIDSSYTLSDGVTGIGVYIPHIKIVFSETLDETTLNTTNINVGSATGSLTYDAVTKTATYTFGSLPLSDSTAYTLSISEIRDSAGNAITASSTGFTTGKRVRILKTGQTTSYPNGDATDRDDGFYQKGAARSYTRDNVNGIVTDNVTGLIWQDNESVQKPWMTQANYNAGNYLDTSGDTAATYCSDLTLDGQNPWRLPTRSELIMLEDYGKLSNPLIDMTFQNSISNTYLSSSVNVYDSSEVWIVYFNRTRSFEAGSKLSSSYYVRCVRNESESTPILLRNNINNSVIDTGSGLIWQDDGNVSINTYTWNDAINYCENEIGGNGTYASYSDWRLPTINELLTLVDDTKRNPAIYDTFVNTVSNYNWSSTTAASDISQALHVHFLSGNSLYRDKNNTFHIRCVRGGISEAASNTAPTISSAVISPPSPTASSTLSVSVVASDADNDPLSYSYKWYVNSIIVQATSSSILESSYFNTGDTVYAQVTVNDGKVNSAPVNSPSVVVQ